MLGVLTASSDDRVLIDYRTSDDAGVYKLDETRALVQTVDFFTPGVDDPETYGRIAAANALSDVYAMGGRPLTALAIAGFPKEADPAILAAIFQGGLRTLTDAGVALLGGHTVQDQEIKFGYAITGEVDPRRIWSNGGAKPGDRLDQQREVVEHLPGLDRDVADDRGLDWEYTERVLSSRDLDEWMRQGW